MTETTLTALLGWSALINYAVLLLWFALFSFNRDFVYTLHTRWFNLEQAGFDTIHYAAMAGYKLLVLVFNLVPWLVLTLLV